MAVRILIADDDAAIRRLLRRLIENHENWSVCGDAQDGKDAIGKAEALSPDVIVLDLAMPEMNGFQAARAITRAHPDVPILLLTVQQLSKELTGKLNTQVSGAQSRRVPAAKLCAPSKVCSPIKTSFSRLAVTFLCERFPLGSALPLRPLRLKAFVSVTVLDQLAPPFTLFLS